MEVKGTAIKSISDFVKKEHSAKYTDWLRELPEASRNLIKGGIYATDWYPLEEAAIIPTRKIAEMFFPDLRTGAWQCGRFSAEQSLTGVYKLYVRMSKPSHIIARASKIFSTYYRPSEMNVAKETSKSVELHITKFDMLDKIIEFRIAGWMEKALEMSGCKNISIKLPSSITRGDQLTIYTINWD